MKHHFTGSAFTLGILGGGQLGRMLLQHCIDFNINTAVMDPDAAAPCRFFCNRFENDHFNDYDAVYRFGKTVSVLTVEIEHVNTDALFQLEKEGLPVYPQPSVLKIVKDKGLQKEFYKTHGIPTALFELLENKDALKTRFQGEPFIIKMRKGGYDGKGVKKISSLKDIDEAFEGPYVVEEAVQFIKEIAVIVSRNDQGETSAYPACEMVFNSEANLVEYLFAPADLTVAQSADAEEIALNVADQLGLTGILAVELFLTSDGRLLVNEIAPRPHNSGHHTIEGSVTSQYEQHLRAILNLPPGATTATSASVMVNLLGEKGFSGEAHYEGIEKVLKMKNTHIHLYGKKETRPFRKMGHVTVTGDNLQEAIQTAEAVKAALKVTSA